MFPDQQPHQPNTNRGQFERHLNAAIDAVSKAGELLLSRRSNPGVTQTKADGTIVTRADLEADQCIQNILSDSLPAAVLKGHSILSEEGIVAPVTTGWIIDPLNGTRNYLAGGSDWGSMVALVRHGEIKVGAINLPGKGVLLAYCAQAHGIAFNGSQIHSPLSQMPALGESEAERVVLFDTFADRFASDAVRDLANLLVQGDSAIESKCSADAFYQLITGKASLLIEYLPTPWDDSAGAAIIRALGGHVIDFEGRDWRPELVKTSSQKESVGKDASGAHYTCACRGLIAGFDRELLSSALSWIRTGMQQKLEPKIENLVDHQQLLPLIAQWFKDEWGQWPQHQSIEKSVAKLGARLGPNSTEQVLVAFDGDKPIGTASLIIQEMTTHPHLHYWLGDLYVLPEHRNLGVGRKLIDGVLGSARKIDAKEVHLYTSDQEVLYSKLGWRTVEYASYDGHQVVIMKIDLI